MFSSFLNIFVTHTDWLYPFVPIESVLKILTSSGLMKHMNPQHIFVTVHDAVMYIQQQKVEIKKRGHTVFLLHEPS